MDHLGNFLGQYLWPDEDWLVREELSCTYWQHRLAQHIQCVPIEDGRLHWQVSTVIVEDVANASMANELCMELNDWTAGWSFAYDAAAHAIYALCSMTALPAWDRFYVRLAEAAKLSAWMSDRIADQLAREVAGRPAFSRPDDQPALRTVPDALYSLMDVIRERPEWVFDPTPHLYPDSQRLAAFFASQMGGTADEVDVDGQGIWLTTLTVNRTRPSHQVHCGFLRSSLYGMSWTSEALFPRIDTLAAPEQVRSLVWEMFLTPGLSLMGGWGAREGSLAYSQVTLAGELRTMEQLPSFYARDEQLLWGLTSTLSDAIDVGVRARDDLNRMRDPERVGRDAREGAAARVLGALRSGQEELLEDLPTGQEERADRRVLWLRPISRLLTTTWFNPMGPTMTTLDLCTGPEGEGRYLVEIMRHPFAPRYLVLARCDSDQDLVQALPEALDDVLVGSIPNMLTLGECPASMIDPVTKAVRDRILAVAAEHGSDLASDARLLAATRGRPWEWVEPPATTSEQAALIEPVAPDAFTTWFSQAAHPDNVDSVLMAFPEPWDGSLNYQMSQGNMARGYFDTSPLFVTYDRTIGWQPADPS